MTSDARNSQMPSLPLVSPVSGLTSTVYGMFIKPCNAKCLKQNAFCILHFAFHLFFSGSGSNCGVKSFAAPGTLYSYGPRYTIGSVSKLPCPGGDGAAHSSVVASHGLLPTALPHLMLVKKLMMNGIWKSPRPQAAKPMITLYFSSSLLCAYCMPPSYMRRFMPPRPWIDRKSVV